VKIHVYFLHLIHRYTKLLLTCPEGCSACQQKIKISPVVGQWLQGSDWGAVWWLQQRIIYSAPRYILYTVEQSAHWSRDWSVTHETCTTARAVRAAAVCPVSGYTLYLA